MSKSVWSFSAVAILVGGLLATGCTPTPPKVHSRTMRKVLTVAASEELRRQLHRGEIDMDHLIAKGEEFTKAACAKRGRPGYSVRDLSDETHDFVTRFGAMSVLYDIDVQCRGPDSPNGKTEIFGSFRFAAIREVSVPEDASWVVQAAWRAVPREGDFSLPLSGSQTGGLSAPGTDDMVARHVELVLSKCIEPAIHRLLDMDGAKRFRERKAAYGFGDCMPEACPHEDGIDCLAVLRLAQKIRDPDLLHPLLAELTDVNRKELVMVADEVCRLMVPKQWTSVLGEKRRGRPTFLSKTSVFLPVGEPVEVNRNAFMAGNESWLLRLEKKMVELVTKWNNANVAAAGVAVEPAEATDPDSGPDEVEPETECGNCGHKGTVHYDEDGNGVCPKCNAPMVPVLPKPLA